MSDVTVTEGNTGTSSANFAVSLSAASTQTVTVSYATANGTAVADSDFVSAGAVLTFAPGQTAQTVAVTVNGDSAVEPTENFFVNLTAPTNATIADGQGVGTITNDDSQPVLSISDAFGAEGNTGQSPITFTVSLSASSSQTVTVNLSTAGGSATSGVDFVALTNTPVSFAPGVTSQTVAVQAIGDTSPEGNETFTASLSTPANATIGDGDGQGTITNDDSVPTLTHRQRDRHRRNRRRPSRRRSP